ncbi:MAG: FkbM family methyltransferase [Thermoleophilaceae bacterium]
MPLTSGWIRHLRPRARAVRGGLHPISALKIAAGRHDDVRLAGVRLTGAHPRGVANTAVEVAAGEYAAPGFEIAPGDRVVDVGANVGAFAVLAARRGAGVEAYEPHPETFVHLERNAAGLAVKCVQAAVVARSPPRGTVTLELDRDSDTRHRVGGSGIEVPAVTLAEAVAGGCDLLKLDCEGAEFELLEATPEDSWREVRRIACEVHPWAGSVEALAGRLSGIGFETRVEPRRAGLTLLFARRRAAGS